MLRISVSTEIWVIFGVISESDKIYYEAPKMRVNLHIDCCLSHGNSRCANLAFYIDSLLKPRQAVDVKSDDAPINGIIFFKKILHSFFFFFFAGLQGLAQGPSKN